jgi:large subunit ribosomal protein L15
MSELSNLRPPAGAVRERKRVGRGESSGWGKTSGAGTKGQSSRQGDGKPKRGFEGGQMRLAMRIPKRGFKPLERAQFALVNIGDLSDAFAPGDLVDLDILRSKGMVKKGPSLLKVLADGEIRVRLLVRAHKFSRSAVEKITASGGSVELIES